MSKHTLPNHMRTSEIKRRLSAMLKAAKKMGFEVGGVRMSADGEITLMDKNAKLRDSDMETKWLGG